MSGNEPPPSAINWEAYSHEELHRMLWQDADVADVSTVADEWTRHRAALVAHAEVLREQRAALLDGWVGAAAEEAAARLGALAGRVEKIGELAAAGERAAQDSADALAAARAAMPPPPAPGTTVPAFAGLPTVPGVPNAPASLGVPNTQAGFASPTAPASPGVPAAPASLGVPNTQAAFASPNAPASPGVPTAPASFGLPNAPTSLGAPNTPTSFGAPNAAASFGVPNAPASFGLPNAPAPFALPTAPAAFALPSAPAPFQLPSAPAPMALPSAPTMPAGATSGFYFYFGAASADQQKAQAVRAMQTYESSLHGSGRLIDDARGNVPQAAPTPRAAAVAQVKTPSSGGVPWQRLVGGGGGGGSVATTRGPVIGAATPVSQQLTPGMRAGVVFGQHGGIAATGTLTADPRTAAQNNAMGAPPPGAGRKDEDQQHENQMPTLDHDLFAVNERVSPAVIGEER